MKLGSSLLKEVKLFILIACLKYIVLVDSYLENEPKFYKPKSKMQELAEEFKKSKVVSEDYKSSKVLT